MVQKDSGSTEQEFLVQVNVIAPQQLKMSLFIPPNHSKKTRYINVSMHSCDSTIQIISGTPSQKEKDRGMMLMFVEQDNHLSLLFYKNSVEILKNGETKEYSPFAKKNAFLSLTNKAIGVEATGLSMLIMNNSGKGTQEVDKGDPIAYDKKKGYEVLIFLNDHEGTKWQFLAGVVRVNLLNPGLDFPHIISTCY